MGHLDIRFHGICTHYRDFREASRLRVVLLQCEGHHALLSVPPDTTIERTGTSACACIEEVWIEGDRDRHFRLDGVHLQVAKPLGSMEGVLGFDPFWHCGVPKLTQLYPELGPPARSKVEQVPPEGVAAWFDVSGGMLQPYVSLKSSVAVRLTAEHAALPMQVIAACWHCRDVVWTFTLSGKGRVRVSNDCGSPGDPGDFGLHYRIAEFPPPQPPIITGVPECLRGHEPDFERDGPPGFGNASIGCSNSQYP